MRTLGAIVRRETAAFFHSAMAPVVIGAFLLLLGWFAVVIFLRYGEASLVVVRSGRTGYLNAFEGVFRPLFSSMMFLLLFLLPAVTMRLISGELQAGRHDLILSWPVTDRAWVLGKWLSALVVAAVLILAGAAHFGVAALLGAAPELLPLLVATVGLSLATATILAWGMVFTALSAHQVLAYFLSFAFVLALYTVGQLAPHLPPFAARLAMAISLQEHYARLSVGILDSRDLVYFIGLTVLGLCVAEAVLAGRRLSLGGRWRPWRPALAVLVALVFLQMVAVRRPLTVDTTPDRRHSLAPQTERILELLAAETAAEPIRILAFFQQIDTARQGLRLILERMAEKASRLSFEFVDIETEPDVLREYGVTTARTVTVEVGDRRQSMLEPDEGRLINTIYRLATGTRPVVYHILGHGEHRLDSEERSGFQALADLLTGNGYELRPLVLPERPEIPPAADAVVLAGPKLDLTVAETAALDAYLEGGGALLALLDPTSPSTVREWTRGYNIVLEGDVIVQADRIGEVAGVGLRTVVVVDGYGEHVAVRDLKGVPTVFPLAQSLHPVQKEMPGLEGEVIILSGPRTWGETDPETKFTGTPSLDQGQDFLGPLPLAVALELAIPDSLRGTARRASGPRRERPESESPVDRLRAQIDRNAAEAARSEWLFDGPDTGRLVVVGNSEFASNANLGLYANRDLVLNLLSWLVQEEDLIELRARPASFQPLLLGENRKRLLGWGAAVGWPLVVMGLSLAVVLSHRRRH